MRILILDQSEDGCRGLETLLRDAGHSLETHRAPPPGSYELAIITRTFAPRASRKLVASLREQNETLPILVLTAEGAIEERVEALEAGADDALAVPFAASQMIARVGALGRRGALAERPPELLEVDGCFIDLSRAKASRDGQAIALTKRELELVRFLHRHRSRAVTRRELLEHVFGVSPKAETRSVDMAIAVLRKKLERDLRSPKIIVSVKSVGYAWGEPILTKT